MPDKDEPEEDFFNCKNILIVGGVIVGIFALWNFYNTSRLHDLVQQLLDRPNPVVYTHDGETETESRIVKTQNGRRVC